MTAIGYIAIAIGGALGALSRFAIDSIISRHTAAAFPIGTFAVNILGSLALGIFMAWLLSRTDTEMSRSFFAIGFLGSFTTFSTFAFQIFHLIERGQAAMGFGYMAASLAFGLMAVAFGFYGGKAVF